MLQTGFSIGSAWICCFKVGFSLLANLGSAAYLESFRIALGEIHSCGLVLGRYFLVSLPLMLLAWYPDPDSVRLTFLSEEQCAAAFLSCYLFNE